MIEYDMKFTSGGAGFPSVSSNAEVEGGGEEESAAVHHCGPDHSSSGPVSGSAEH
jgi:hypothetical protein